MKKLSILLIVLSMCLPHLVTASNLDTISKVKNIEAAPDVDWVVLTAAIVGMAYEFDDSNITRNNVNSYSVHVYDVQGNLVYNKTQNNREFDLDNLSSGTYTVYVKFNGVNVLSKSLTL